MAGSHRLSLPAVLSLSCRLGCSEQVSAANTLGSACMQVCTTLDAVSLTQVKVL